LIYKKLSFNGGLSSTAYLIERLGIKHVEDAIALPLKGGRIEKSLLDMHIFLSSFGGFRRSLYPILALIRHRKREMYKKLSRDLSFFDIMSIIEPNTWGDYLKHRFSSQTFWSLYPFIPLIERKNDRILDLGCGAGHASFVLSKNMNPKKLVCADDNYTLLFLAKRFMAMDANFICLDANSPLPFSDNFFSSIVMMDSLHYLPNRALIGKECRRMLKKHGLLLLLHLHNALKDNINIGFALSPSTWKGLFQWLNPSLIPENSLIEDLMLRFELDLTKTYNNEILNGSNAVSLIGTEDNVLFDKYYNLDSYLEKNLQNPIINPIYKLKHRNKEVILERKPPNDIFVVEYPLSMRFLPKEYSVSPEVLKTIENQKAGKLYNVSKDKMFSEMLRRFIFIDTPKGYV